MSVQFRSKRWFEDVAVVDRYGDANVDTPAEETKQSDVKQSEKTAKRSQKEKPRGHQSNAKAFSGDGPGAVKGVGFGIASRSVASVLTHSY